MIHVVENSSKRQLKLKENILHFLKEHFDFLEYVFLYIDRINQIVNIYLIVELLIIDLRKLQEHSYLSTGLYD